MGCLFALFGAFFPRLAVLFIWLARPALFSAALSPLFAILGIIFLPFTTLFYVLLWNPATGIVGFDWLWLGLAFLIDLGGMASSAYSNKERAQSAYSSYRGG
jgi:hypothetical protein